MGILYFEWRQTGGSDGQVSMINFMMQLTDYIKKTRNLRAKADHLTGFDLFQESCKTCKSMQVD